MRTKRLDFTKKSSIFLFILNINPNFALKYRNMFYSFVDYVAD